MRDAAEDADGRKLTTDRFGRERRMTLLSTRETLLIIGERQTGYGEEYGVGIQAEMAPAVYIFSLR